MTKRSPWECEVNPSLPRDASDKARQLGLGVGQKCAVDLLF